MRHKKKLVFSLSWSCITICWMYINWYLINKHEMQLYGVFHPSLLAIFLIGIFLASLVVHSLMILQGGTLAFRFFKVVLSFFNLALQGYTTLMLLMTNNGSI